MAEMLSCFNLVKMNSTPKLIAHGISWVNREVVSNVGYILYPPSRDFVVSVRLILQKRQIHE